MRVEGLEDGSRSLGWRCRNSLGSDIFIVDLGRELLVNILVMEQDGEAKNSPIKVKSVSRVQAGCCLWRIG